MPTAATRDTAVVVASTPCGDTSASASAGGRGCPSCRGRGGDAQPQVILLFENQREARAFHLRRENVQQHNRLAIGALYFGHLDPTHRPRCELEVARYLHKSTAIYDTTAWRWMNQTAKR